ncbi:MAG: Protein translocase subunit SecA, partial [Candidatus Azambacteria bacterium GW2011_GWA1_44_9]
LGCLEKMMEFLKMPEDMPIENRMVSRALESAQKKVEGHNFDIRKHLLDYDDVLNKHRGVIYKKRREILAEYETEKSGCQKDVLKARVLELVEQEIEQIVFEFEHSG